MSIFRCFVCKVSTSEPVDQQNNANDSENHPKNAQVLVCDAEQTNPDDCQNSQ